MKRTFILVAALALSACTLHAQRITAFPSGTIEQADVSLFSKANGSATYKATIAEFQSAIPTGATVASSLADALGTVYNVVNFGVVADGTDQSANLQAALDAAGANGKIFIPDLGADIVFASTLTLLDGQSIEGEAGGPQDSPVRLRYSGTAWAMEPANLLANAVNWTVKNLAIECGATANGAINAFRLSYSTFDNLYLEGGHVAIQFNGNVTGQAYFNRVTQVKAGYQTHYGLSFTNGANWNNVYGGWIGGSPTGAVFTVASSLNSLHGVGFQGVGGATPTTRHVFNNGGPNSFLGCRFEAATGAALTSGANGVNELIAPGWGGSITTYEETTGTAATKLGLQRRPGGTDSYLNVGKFQIYDTFNSTAHFVNFGAHEPSYSGSHYWRLGYNLSTASAHRTDFYDGTTLAGYVDHKSGLVYVNTIGGGLSIYDGGTITRTATGRLRVSNDLTIADNLAVVSVTLNGSDLATLLAAKQAADADLDDLADGELSGNKIGTGLNGANITTGYVPPANLGSGTRTGSKFLRDDGQWDDIPGVGDAVEPDEISAESSTIADETINLDLDLNGLGLATSARAFELIVTAERSDIAIPADYAAYGIRYYGMLRYNGPANASILSLETAHFETEANLLASEIGIAVSNISGTPNQIRVAVTGNAAKQLNWRAMARF